MKSDPHQKGQASRLKHNAHLNMRQYTSRQVFENESTERHMARYKPVRDGKCQIPGRSHRYQRHFDHPGPFEACIAPVDVADEPGLFQQALGGLLITLKCRWSRLRGVPQRSASGRAASHASGRGCRPPRASPFPRRDLDTAIWLHSQRPLKAKKPQMASNRVS